MKEMKLYLLLAEEAEKLTEEQRIAKYNGKPCWWWLRSPGIYGDCAACVFGVNGDVSAHGFSVSIEFGVRPALHLKSSICDKLPKTEDGSVLFGKNSKTGEPVEWLLIEEKNGVVTLLSKDCLVLHCFNEDVKKGNDFATSDVAAYMNTEMLSRYFTVEEQEMILLEVKGMETIKNALETVDRDEASAYMAELLMNTDVTTYKMFEGLAAEYLNANEDTRKGIDTALEFLTYKNLEEIAETLVNM